MDAESLFPSEVPARSAAILLALCYFVRSIALCCTAAKTDRQGKRRFRLFGAVIAVFG